MVMMMVVVMVMMMMMMMMMMTTTTTTTTTIMMMSACELILEMIKYDDKDAILRGLVQLLQPSSDEVNRALFTIMLGHSYTLSVTPSTVHHHARSFLYTLRTSLNMVRTVHLHGAPTFLAIRFYWASIMGVVTAS